MFWSVLYEFQIIESKLQEENEVHKKKYKKSRELGEGIDVKQMSLPPPRKFWSDVPDQNSMCISLTLIKCMHQQSSWKTL